MAEAGGWGSKKKVCFSLIGLLVLTAKEARAVRWTVKRVGFELRSCG
ncbi:MAG: hypothetical protein ACKERG_01160 [Candidatus Hodgkinia cicadicola]